MDELNLTHRYKDDFTQTEREIVMRRANKAVDRLLEVYENGEAKVLNKAYRSARIAGTCKVSFAHFKQGHMIKMIRTVADTQRKKERKGLEI